MTAPDYGKKRSELARGLVSGARIPKHLGSPPLHSEVQPEHANAQNDGRGESEKGRASLPLFPLFPSSPASPPAPPTVNPLQPASLERASGRSEASLTRRTLPTSCLC
jgi:hypothetical protein